MPKPVKSSGPSAKSAKRGKTAQPLVGVIMGSISDWETMKDAADTLKQFGIPYEAKVVSAHRTPELMVEYAQGARARGIEIIIAGAGGAAHLPGMTASLTSLPVIGVPVSSKHLKGIDSLLSIAQMPAGIPVATMAIGNAKNAALMAARILALKHPAMAKAVDSHREGLARDVRAMRIPEA